MNTYYVVELISMKILQAFKDVMEAVNFVIKNSTNTLILGIMVMNDEMAAR